MSVCVLAAILCGHTWDMAISQDGLVMFGDGGL